MLKTLATLLAVTAGISAPAFAQQTQPNAPENARKTPSGDALGNLEGTGDAPALDFAIVPADLVMVSPEQSISNWIGQSVRARTENVGEIIDVIVEVEEGQYRVSGAILSVGGFLGIGDTKLIVPLEMFRLETDGTDVRLSLPLTPEELAAIVTDAKRVKDDLDKQAEDVIEEMEQQEETGEPSPLR